MINHYAITSELGRQRREDIAASFARSRRSGSDAHRRSSRHLRLRHWRSRTALVVASETRVAATV
jgi:hypothetical protein